MKYENTESIEVLDDRIIITMSDSTIIVLNKRWQERSQLDAVKKELERLHSRIWWLDNKIDDLLL